MSLVLPATTRKKLPSGNYAFYAGGEVVGMVKATTKDTSIVSALSGRPGPKKWYPTDCTGTALVPSLTFDTLKDAGRCLLQIIAPVQATLTRNRLNGLVAGALYWRGHVFWVSRWPGESHWVVDGHIPVGAFCPSFCNGEGSRCQSSNVLKDGEWTEVLDAELAKLGK